MYYEIELDWDPKVIGVKNGVYQAVLDRKAYDSGTNAKIDSLFMGELTANQSFPGLDFDFYFKKLKSAKMTSFMSFCPYLNHCHFLVQENELELFKTFNVQYYKDYKAVVYYSPADNVDNSFRLFQMVLQDWNVIDFRNTVFKSGGFGNNPKIEHLFTDENEMRRFNGIPRVKTLALTKDFDRSLDFFHTRLGGLFVSEKLKLALEKNNATGVKYYNDVQVLM